MDVEAPQPIRAIKQKVTFELYKMETKKVIFEKLEVTVTKLASEKKKTKEMEVAP